MLCCVGGFASRMGDLLAPPHFGGSDFASRMGDLLAPPQFRVPNGGFISPAPGLATGLVDIGFTRWMPPMQNWALFGSSGFWGEEWEELGGWDSGSRWPVSNGRGTATARDSLIAD